MIDDSFYGSYVYLYMSNGKPKYSLQWVGHSESLNEGNTDELLGDLIQLASLRQDLKAEGINLKDLTDARENRFWKYKDQFFLYDCAILIGKYVKEDLEYWKDLEFENYDFFEIANTYIDMIVNRDITLNLRTFDSFISFYGLSVPPRVRGSFSPKITTDNFVWSFESLQSSKLTVDYVRSECNNEHPFYQYTCHGYRDVVMATLQFLALNECTVKRCNSCGRLFIPSKKANQKYCSRFVEGKSCVEEGRKKARREREAKNLVNKRYNSVNTNLARWAKDKRIGKWRRDERLEFLFNFRDEYQILKKTLNEEALIDWLNEMNCATHSDL